jgi:choline dehydrogenase
MLSGIGPAEHLKSKGIEVLLDRPGVGSNLQDHLEIYVQQACKTPITLYKYWNNLSKLLIGFKWMLAKKGLGASNHFETAGFIRSRAGIEYPNVQFHFLPIAVRYDGKVASDGHGWQAHVGPMRSDSRGEVRLRSKSFEDEPIIKFNYMNCETDWIEFRKCVRITRTIFGQAAFDDVRGDEIAPGKECQSNEDIDAFIRQNAESAYHPCGTCKMGAVSDVMAVVDPECRVIGTRGLRVVDSSIFPSIPNGNINAPTIMVAEKASDHILKKKPLKADNSKPWINPRWKASDR